MNRQDQDDRDARDDRDERDDREGRRRERAARDADDEGERPRRHAHRERGVVLFADQSGSIIRAGDEALEEDLPVLNAFRQFLDAERRRARRQLITMITVFTVVLAGLAGGGAWFLRHTLERMETGIAADKIRQQEERLVTVSNLQTVAKAAVSLRKDVLDTRTATSALQDKVKDSFSELDRLLDTITTLELQNATLQRSVRKLDPPPEKAPAPEPPDAFESLPPAPPPAAVPKLETMREPARPAPAAEPPPPVLAPEPVRPDAPPAAPDGGAVDRTPGGVPFRLSLPKG
jgi:hypothetical protein